MLVLVWLALLPASVALRAELSCGAHADTLPPPLPSSFSGTVTLNGLNAPWGTVITVGSGGIVYAQTAAFLYEGVSVYRIDAPGDNANTPEREGGVEEEVLQFTIGEVAAQQTAIWLGGSSQGLDLTVPTLHFHLPLILR